MKNILLIISIMVVSCTSTKKTSIIESQEKNNILIENNERFSNVTVVGKQAAEEIESVKKIAKNNSQVKTIEKLRKIDGISIELDKNKKIIKASLQNDILFKFNSADIEENAKKTLKNFAQVILNKDDSTKLHIIGHTDNIGKKDFNQVLSEARAKAVANMLIQFGLKDNIIEITGKGFTQPIMNNNTSEARKKNRRVEIFVK